MSDDRRFLDLQQIEQTGCVLRQKIETVMDVCFGRFPEADLVRDNYPESAVRQKLWLAPNKHPKNSCRAAGQPFGRSGFWAVGRP